MRMRHGAPAGERARKGTFGRLLKYLFKYHKVAMITVFFCLLVTAISNAAAPIFLNNMIVLIGNGVEKGKEIYSLTNDLAQASAEAWRRPVTSNTAMPSVATCCCLFVIQSSMP